VHLTAGTIDVSLVLSTRKTLWIELYAESVLKCRCCDRCFMAVKKEKSGICYIVTFCNRTDA